jgi:cytochrome c-type biogenesis protein CcmH
MSWRSLFAALGLVLGVACLAHNPAHAVQADEVLTDPALEARARDISAGLRCLVCQNQSIDDSDAPLARDLRVLVRERLKAGDSDSQVIDFLVSRYGEFVLLKPRFAAHTALLWGVPVMVLIAGAILAAFTLRRRALPAAPTPGLTAEESERVEKLMQSQ